MSRPIDKKSVFYVLACVYLIFSMGDIIYKRINIKKKATLETGFVSAI